MKYFLLAALFVSVCHLGNGDSCGSQSNTYCLTERQYVSCDTSIANRELKTCPFPNQRCGDVASSCTTDLALATTKSVCKMCSTFIGAGHACTSFTHFEKCVDGEFERTDSFECPVGTYCDAYSANPDKPCSAFTGRQLLCWQELEPVPEPEKSDEEKCAELGDGKYPVVGDSTCRNFLSCTQNSGGQWFAARLVCPQPNHFWPQIQVCVPPLVYPCPQTAQALRRVPITASLNPNATIPAF